MQPVRKGEIVSWALYDFANSAFTTSIVTVFFSRYFSQKVVPEGFEPKGTVLWSWAVGLSYALACLCAPVIGAICDYTALKKRFFTVFWLVGVLASAGLFFVDPGEVKLGLILFVLANFGFAGGNSLYNAFVVELAPPESMGKVSAFGWATGYAGGGACLLLNLGMLGWIGGGIEALQWCFLAVAVWWFVFALPFVLGVKERAAPKPRPKGISLIRLGFLDVAGTLKNIRMYRHLFLFLLAFLLYNAGIEAVFANAALYAETALKMDDKQIVPCFLVVQGVGVVGAMALGWLSGRGSGKGWIVATLYVWIGVLVFAWFTRSPAMFWILSVFVGFVMGGTQALSRSLFALLTPASKSAEFFGFFAIGGRAAGSLGLMVFGTAGTFAPDVVQGMRWGIASLVVFFIGGLLVLRKVDATAGMAVAQGEGGIKS